MQREIDLQLMQLFSMSLDLKNITPDQVVDPTGKLAIHIATIDFGKINIELETIRKNGAQILYAAIGIEKQLEDIILIYLFGPFTQQDEKREFFINFVLESSSMEFSYKKELATKIIEKCALLAGKEKNDLQAKLKKIQDWRNIFAHGRLQYDARAGGIISYFSGSTKTLSLDDAYWDDVESCFVYTMNLLTVSLANLNGPNPDEHYDARGTIKI